MGSRAVEYGREERMRGRRRGWRPVVGGVAVLVAVVGMFVVTVGRTRVLVDGVSGSRKVQSTWLGLWTRTRSDVSPLERRLRRSGIGWTPSWRCVSTIDRNALGMRLVAAYEAAPPVFRLAATSEFVQGASDDELRGLVRVMESGTEAEQEEAVRRAGGWAVKRAGKRGGK